MKRDYKVSIIRILSMVSIVLCHLFQAKEMSIAFWFIPVILICYLITPILQKVIKLNKKHRKIKRLI